MSIYETLTGDSSGDMPLRARTPFEEWSDNARATLSEYFRSQAQTSTAFMLDKHDQFLARLAVTQDPTERTKIAREKARLDGMEKAHKFRDYIVNGDYANPDAAQPYALFMQCSRENVEQEVAFLTALEVLGAEEVPEINISDERVELRFMRFKSVADNAYVLKQSTKYTEGEHAGVAYQTEYLVVAPAEPSK